MKTRHGQDTWLYALVAGLFAAQTYVAAGELPAFLYPYIGIAYAMVLAVKVKRSKGKEDN